MVQAKIREEHNQLTQTEGMKLQFRISIALVFFALAADLLIGYIGARTRLSKVLTGEMNLLLILRPTMINLVLLGVGYWVRTTERIALQVKPLLLSLVVVAITNVLCIVFSSFYSGYYFYSLAIFLTVMYADQFITRMVFGASLVSVLVFEMWLLLMNARQVDFVMRVNLLIATVTLCISGIICEALVQFARDRQSASVELEHQRLQLEQRLRVDAMTGLYNKLEFYNILTHLVGEKRTSTLAVVIIDMDNFKEVNDVYGHKIGDDCLLALSIILHGMSSLHMAFRFGGDEFCLVIEGMSAFEIEKHCQTIAQEFQSMAKMVVPDSNFTLSAGVALYQEGQSVSELFTAADHALYEAKKTRNRVFVAANEKPLDERLVNETNQ